jgi:hypothetical protein
VYVSCVSIDLFPIPTPNIYSIAAASGAYVGNQSIVSVLELFRRGGNFVIKWQTICLFCYRGLLIFPISTLC